MNDWIEKQDSVRRLQLQRDLIATYRDDFNKYRHRAALQKTPCWRQEAAERTAGQRLVEKEGAAHWVARGPWVGLSVALLWGAYSRGTQAVLRRI
jgi:hypothetical protein